MSANKASTWLLEQRTARGLSLRELGRLTNITHTTLSDAEKGDASPETWKRLAEYFKMPPDLVLIWAGFLEALPQKDDLIQQIDYDLEQMSPAGRKRAAALIRSLLDSE
jgi:transcriptional regulator with XRE-family HTH domain